MPRHTIFLLTAALAAMACHEQPRAGSHPSAAVATPSIRGDVYFGIVDPAQRSFIVGDMFEGTYVQTKGFIPEPDEPSNSAEPGVFLDATDAVPQHRALTGVDVNRSAVSVMIDSLVPDGYELGEGEFFAHANVSALRPNYPIFFWTEPQAVTVLTPASATLTPQQSEQLTQVANQLYTEALADGEPEIDQRATLSLDDPRVERVPGADSVLAVYYPVQLTSPNGVVDHRGSIFIIYAPETQRIIFSAFGHPEWSPVAQHVRAVDPMVYFRVAGDSRVYFFGEYSGAWQDEGYAIVELATGRPVLKT